MAASVAMLAVPARKPGTLLCLEHPRRHTPLRNSVGIKTVRVVTLATLPRLAQRSFTQVWRVSQIPARMCEGTSITADAIVEESGAHLRSAELMYDNWRHRHERGLQRSAEIVAETAASTQLIRKDNIMACVFTSRICAFFLCTQVSYED